MQGAWSAGETTLVCFGFCSRQAPVQAGFSQRDESATVIHVLMPRRPAIGMQKQVHVHRLTQHYSQTNVEDVAAKIRCISEVPSGDPSDFWSQIQDGAN